MQLEELKKKSCVLSWKAPEFDGGSPVAGYNVERQQPFSNRWSKVNKEIITKTKYEIKDLVELEEYNFRVVAKNEAGIGKPSEQTGAIVPKDPYSKPGAPGQPELSDILKESATLSWNEPKDDGNSPITNYIIEMRASGSLGWNVVNKERVTRTQFTVQGLREGTQYEFRVSAENAVGQGLPSLTSETVKYG